MPKECGPGETLRKGYTAVRAGKQVYVPPSCVPDSSTLKTRSGKKFASKVDIEEGGLHGWHSDLGAAKRHEILTKVAREDGYATAVRRLNFISVTGHNAEAKEDMRWLKSNRSRLELEARAPACGLGEIRSEGHYIVRGSRRVWVPGECVPDLSGRGKSKGLWYIYDNAPTKERAEESKRELLHEDPDVKVEIKEKDGRFQVWTDSYTAIEGTEFDPELEARSSFDPSKLDPFEQQTFASLERGGKPWQDSVRTMVNSTEGDFSQLSPYLAKKAREIGITPENYADDYAPLEARGRHEVRTNVSWMLRTAQSHLMEEAKDNEWAKAEVVKVMSALERADNDNFAGPEISNVLHDMVWHLREESKTNEWARQTLPRMEEALGLAVSARKKWTTSKPFTLYLPESIYGGEIKTFKTGHEAIDYLQTKIPEEAWNQTYVFYKDKAVPKEIDVTRPVSEWQGRLEARREVGFVPDEHNALKNWVVYRSFATKAEADHIAAEATRLNLPLLYDQKNKRNYPIEYKVEKRPFKEHPELPWSVVFRVRKPELGIRVGEDPFQRKTMVIDEIEAAARQVAAQGGDGGLGSELPAAMSIAAVEEINADIPGFMDLVRKHKAQLEAKSPPATIIPEASVAPKTQIIPKHWGASQVWAAASKAGIPPMELDTVVAKYRDTGEVPYTVGELLKADFTRLDPKILINEFPQDPEVQKVARASGVDPDWYKKESQKYIGSKGHVDRVQASKEIKKALAQKFPGVKFKVRLSRYSGGDSIDIHWTDGPTSKDVEAITSQYESVRYDPYSGETLLGGNSYVSAQRRESKEAMEWAKKFRDQRYGSTPWENAPRQWEEKVFQVWAQTSFDSKGNPVSTKLEARSSPPDVPFTESQPFTLVLAPEVYGGDKRTFQTGSDLIKHLVNDVPSEAWDSVQVFYKGKYVPDTVNIERPPEQWKDVLGERMYGIRAKPVHWNTVALISDHFDANINGKYVEVTKMPDGNWGWAVEIGVGHNNIEGTASTEDAAKTAAIAAARAGREASLGARLGKTIQRWERVEETPNDPSKIREKVEFALREDGKILRKDTVWFRDSNEPHDYGGWKLYGGISQHGGRIPVELFEQMMYDKNVTIAANWNQAGYPKTQYTRVGERDLGSSLEARKGSKEFWFADLAHKDHPRTPTRVFWDEAKKQWRYQKWYGNSKDTVATADSYAIGGIYEQDADPKEVLRSVQGMGSYSENFRPISGKAGNELVARVNAKYVAEKWQDYVSSIIPPDPATGEVPRGSQRVDSLDEAMKESIWHRTQGRFPVAINLSPPDKEPIYEVRVYDQPPELAAMGRTIPLNWELPVAEAMKKHNEKASIFTPEDVIAAEANPKIAVPRLPAPDVPLAFTPEEKKRAAEIIRKAAGYLDSSQWREQKAIQGLAFKVEQSATSDLKFRPEEVSKIREWLDAVAQKRYTMWKYPDYYVPPEKLLGPLVSDASALQAHIVHNPSGGAEWRVPPANVTGLG